MDALPANLKAIGAFLKLGSQFTVNASQLDGRAADTMRVMAYFTRYYALERGLQLKKDAADDAYLEKLFPLLSDAKPHLPAGGDEEHFKLVGEFVFGKFEDLNGAEERGESTKETARGFMECSNLFRVITTFPDQVAANGIEEEINSKVIFCMTKAQEIVRRAPGSHTAPTMPSAPGPTQAPAAMPPAAIPAGAPPSAHAPPPDPSTFAPTISVAADDLLAAQRDRKLTPAVSDAIEYLEFAIAHLRHNEVAKAKSQIDKALGQIK